MGIENNGRLAAVGPADPVHGFPLWFDDGAGNVLELGLGPDANLPAIDDPVRSHVPAGMRFPEFFPEEAFYFLAEARMPIGGPGGLGRARLILGLEAAFSTPQPDPRGRVVFARIRIRIDDLVPNSSYTITHPYGVIDDTVAVADENGRVFVTDDRGIADNDFTAVLRMGQVAPFLRWDTGAPVGYLGDGATPHTVTGSPLGTDYFQIEGKDASISAGVGNVADPLNPKMIRTSLFTVQGKTATRAGTEITAAHLVRSGGAVIIDLHARSRPGQNLEVGGVGVRRTALIGAGPDYVVRADADSVPAAVQVVNLTDVPPSVVEAPVTDRVMITGAIHDVAAQQLSVTAASSDDTATLHVDGIGPMTGATTGFGGIVATPAEITVSSNRGGRAAVAVTLTGARGAALPLIADAGPSPRHVLKHDVVQLDGRASRSGVTAWAWAHTGGPAVGLSSATDPAPTFTADTVGTVSFALTVTAAGGQAGTTVDIVVDDFPDDVLTVTNAEFRTGRAEFRISGTQSGVRPARVTVAVGPQEIGSALVDATGAWSVRKTLVAGDGIPAPAVGDTVAATSSRGGTAGHDIDIRN